MVDKVLFDLAQEKYNSLKETNPDLFNQELDNEVLEIIKTERNTRTSLLLSNVESKRLFMSLPYAQFLSKYEHISKELMFIKAFEIETSN